MTWDGAASSASLAKDIAAFANSRGGGILVIGKSELSDGTFDFTGLSQDQAKSFETTKVSAFVNSRFGPAIRLSCCPISREGKFFVVIRIAEFDEIPAMCLKDFPSTHGKFILRSGCIHVRTAEAASALIQSVEDLRAIIGISTTKQRDRIAELVRAVATGQSIVPPPPVEELYAVEREIVAAEATAWRKRTNDSTAGWRLSFFPKNRLQRWPDEESLAEVAKTWTIRMNQWDFPVGPRCGNGVKSPRSRHRGRDMAGTILCCHTNGIWHRSIFS